MTGPDHYREAERLLGVATEGLPSYQHEAVVAEAQVHATLAVAAAQIELAASMQADNGVSVEWLGAVT